jgi:hypothetical protein
MKKIKDFILQAYKDFGKLKIILAFLLLFGTISGEIWSKNFPYETLQKLDFFFFSDFEFKTRASFFTNFLSSLGASSIFFFSIIIMTFSILGIIGIFAVIALKGIGFGVILGNLYKFYSLKGAIAGTFILLPGAFFSAIALILIASESFVLTLNLLRKTLSGSNENNISFLNYIKKMGLSGLILIFSAVTDSLLIMFLSGFF